MDYTQQMLVNEIGISGQNKLKKARVLLVGAGGLGVPLATYIAGMGIGRIGIIDGDTIETSNLHRQFMYNNQDVGLSKSIILQEKLRLLNSDIEIVSFNYFIDESNISDVIKQFDIICDCTDNSKARFLLDAHCSQVNKPIIYGVCRDWQGYVTILNYNNKVRLTDLFSVAQMQLEEKNNCSNFGIISSVCGIIASYQATEVFKLITGQKLLLDGSILCINALTNSSKIFKIHQT